MSSEQLNDTTTPSIAQTAVNTSPDRRLGRVKWFNNKAGYGFLKVVENDGSETEDVFVHHSSIKVAKEQFKYLVQGEYIDFTIGNIETGDHKFQATEVSGVNGCKLMCETRNEAFKTRSNEGENDFERTRVRPSRQRQPSSSSYQKESSHEEQRQYSRPPRSTYGLKQKQPLVEGDDSGGKWNSIERRRRF